MVPLPFILGGDTHGGSVLESCDLHTRFTTSESAYYRQKWVLSSTLSYSNGPTIQGGLQGTLIVEASRNRLLLTFITDGGQIWSQNLQGSTWSSWGRNDNYGTTSLSELASALGVDSEIMYDVYNDLNDVITPCRMLLLPGSQTYTNAPSQFTGKSTEGVLVVFPFTTNVSNPRIGQFILSNIGFFLRFKSSGGWTNWVQVANV